MIEILVGGVVLDTTSDELTAGALKHALEGIGWKNVTTRHTARGISGSNKKPQKGS